MNNEQKSHPLLNPKLWRLLYSVFGEYLSCCFSRIMFSSKQKSSLGGFLVFCSVVISFHLLLIRHVPIAYAQGEDSVVQEVQDIRSQYSLYLDSQWTGRGWDYAVPSSQYKEVGRNSFNNLRMQATFAQGYNERQDDVSKERVRLALLNALVDLPKRQVDVVVINGNERSTRSFNDAIGLFLTLRTLEERPDWFSWTERREMIENAKRMLPWVLKAPDTENRALLGAAYGLAILRHPLVEFSREEIKEYERLIRGKAIEGLKSVDRDSVYREGTPRKFSIHYHLVSANMLFYLCHGMSEQKYCKTAIAMTKVARSWYPKGKLSWRGSLRPRGIGLQTVFLRTLAEKLSGNANWAEFWEVEKINRGFIDPKRPNRLVWKDEKDGTLNDDYSFVSMLALLLP